MGGRKKINKTEVSFGRKIFLFFLFKKDKKKQIAHLLVQRRKKKKIHLVCTKTSICKLMINNIGADNSAVMLN